MNANLDTLPVAAYLRRTDGIRKCVAVASLKKLDTPVPSYSAAAYWQLPVGATVRLMDKEGYADLTGDLVVAFSWPADGDLYRLTLTECDQEAHEKGRAGLPDYDDDMPVATC